MEIHYYSKVYIKYFEQQIKHEFDFIEKLIYQLLFIADLINLIVYLFFTGDLQNEDSVLEWLIDDDNRELADEIESVNERMLERLLDESPFLAVFFCKYIKLLQSLKRM